MPDKIEKNKILKILKVQKDNEEIYRPISEWKPQPESGAELSSQNECLCPINLAPFIGCALEALTNDTNIVLQEGPLGQETRVLSAGRGWVSHTELSTEEWGSHPQSKGNQI